MMLVTVTSTSLSLQEYQRIHYIFDNCHKCEARTCALAVPFFFRLNHSDLNLALAIGWHHLGLPTEEIKLVTLWFGKFLIISKTLSVTLYTCWISTYMYINLYTWELLMAQALPIFFLLNLLLDPVGRLDQ